MAEKTRPRSPGRRRDGGVNFFHEMIDLLCKFGVAPQPRTGGGGRGARALGARVATVQPRTHGESRHESLDETGEQGVRRLATTRSAS